MSDRDAFDGDIERLFARPQPFNDGEAFEQRISRRLNRGWRARAVILTAAGTIGGFFAVREALDSGLSGGLARLSNESGQVTQAASELNWSTAMDWFSTGGADLGMSPAMPLFWVVSGLVILAAVFTALKASEVN